MAQDDKKWNVPGNIEYKDTEPLDVLLRSQEDQKLRGYWLGRDRDGQLVFVSNQNQADHVRLQVGEDGNGEIVYSDETTELTYDGVTMRIERYS